MGSLYFGDNLDILREHISDESVDLVYLDPPFNSKRDYNVFLKTPKGHESDAQISAFDDSWRWGAQAEEEFALLLHQPNTDVSEMIQSLRRFLKESDMMAYLVMMANRLLQLHRVLKPTGSLYLHCDPTASHYLKIVMDTVFGPERFGNEISWQRTAVKGDARRKFGAVHDVLLRYTKSADYVFNVVYAEQGDEYHGRFKYDDGDGRGPYQSAPLDSPNPRPNLTYEFKSFKPPSNGWRVSLEVMDRLDSEGRLIYPPNRDGRIRRKVYLSDQGGPKVTDVWLGISPLQGGASERLGYPTQKPLALLERIINASSNRGDVVLDPFCGCGTAVHAAQALGREWIGIDITHLAVSLIEKRMKAAFPGIQFEVFGTPKDVDGARNLAERDKYQFQFWVLYSLLENAQPYKGGKKGADTGIDGIIFFQDDDKIAKKAIVSVKGGENVGVTMVKDLIATVEREKAQMGFFVTLAEPTRPMVTEAVSAGYYESPLMGAYPKIQILTIADLMSGKAKPNYPDLARGGLNFKKAKVETQRAAQGELEGL